MSQMVTMVFTDLVNSTAVKNHLPGSDITARNRIYRDTILLPHRQRVENSLNSYNGRKVETIGDAFFLVFPNPIPAVQWAVAIQINHLEEPISTPLGSLQLKIGMHTGCPLAEGNNFIGQEVDYTARVAALANAGQILLSEVTAAFVRSAGIANLALHSHGERDLKGIGTVPIFELLYNNKQPQPLKESKPISFGGIGTVIDWRGNCRELLVKGSRLTTNPLTAGEGLGFELEEVYVPLGLVERQQQRIYNGDISPEQGSLLYEPETSEEISKTFQLSEFFDQVLRDKKSQRIAIIGEPGAGKTTLLQKIAAWILEQTEDIPIWVSLADLQGKTLEEYLLQNWLKAVTKKVRITPEIEDALGELFNSKKVWVLLDAVDEMAIESENALAKIANQLTGWIADAQVVLTCRLNVWDAGKNALEAFETYRNLDFSYGDAKTPDQVGQFIRSWFREHPILGEHLRAELDVPGRERIKDTVKNPLRLALLCRSWYRHQGEFPTTRAALYNQFIAALYQWKQDRFPTNSTKRRKLNQALGELAILGLNEKTKFRLPHSLLSSVLGAEDEELFQLALQLGFLNQVGVAAESSNRGEKVYAFYHPTFQEYFAAQYINDWHYFFNHKLVKSDAAYRIFERQWKEIILLWLGREDVTNEQKEEFIQALISFEDGCGEENFYGIRAYLLAAAGIAEFSSCSCSETIINQIIHWSFTDYQLENQGIAKVDNLFKEEARKALLYTDIKRVISGLIQLIQVTERSSTVWQAALILGQIDPGNQEAISQLIRLMQTKVDKSTRIKAIQILKQIAPGNPQVCTALIEQIQSEQDELTRLQIARNIGEIDSSNELAKNILLEMSKSNNDEYIRWQAARALGAIEPGNQDAIATFRELIHTSQSENIRAIAAWKLGQVDPGNNDAITQLIDLINTSSDDYIRWLSVETLGEIGGDNKAAISALINLVHHTSDHEYICRQAIRSLGKFGDSSSEVITTISQVLHSSTNQFTLCQAANSLAEIAPGNKDIEIVLKQLLSTAENEYVLQKAAEILAKNNSENDDAIDVLINLLCTSQKKDICLQAARSLTVVLQGKHLLTSVSRLKDYCQNEQESYYRVLWHCCQNLNYLDFYLAWHQQDNSDNLEISSNQNSFNLAELSLNIATAIASEPDLIEKIQLIYVDGGKFIDPDNPAAKIYVEMLKQGCPKCSDGTPKSLAELQVYWDLLNIESEKRWGLIIYNELPSFSNVFVESISKFDGAIVLVTAQNLGNCSLKIFNSTNIMLITEIVAWFREVV